MKCALPGRYNKGKPVSSNNMDFIKSFQSLGHDYAKSTFESVATSMYAGKYIIDELDNCIQSLDELKKELMSKDEKYMEELDKEKKETEVNTDALKMGYSTEELDVLEELAKKYSEGG